MWRHGCLCVEKQHTQENRVTVIRCVNIDWLECYCLEDAIGFPHNAQYFASKGWEVKEREYGTPMYEEMFTLVDHFGEPFIEIRRKPKSVQTLRGIFCPYACHVRLVNRACYANNAAQSMAQFLAENGFKFQRISRIDLCLDFERFDFGDDPQVFLRRFMAGRYSKINQANINAHGLDQWDGREWNSIKWGSPKSMVTTRFYNKTMELQQVHDKPYIRQAWQICGLVDDWSTLEKKRRDGTSYKPQIWRVEFAIKSGTKKWFVVEDYNGDRKRIRSMHNTLDVYSTREKIFDVFLSLCQHYFHFKHVEYKSTSTSATTNALSAITIDAMHPLIRADTKATKELQRKDRCRDKELFRKTDLDVYFQFEKILASKPRDKTIDSLLLKLYAYRERQYQQNVRNACNVLIARLEDETRVKQLAAPLDEDELQVLRRMVAIRLKDKSVDFQTTLEEVRTLFNIEQTIWKNPF